MTVISSNGSRVIRFGVFELDREAGELRRNGSKVRLQEQPLQVLTLLVEHPGEVVSRDELQKRLWPADTFVDFDHSLNAAIRRLRDALGDSAEHPRYVETVARRGYRFLASVNGTKQSEPAPVVTRHRKWPIALAIAVVLAIGVVVGFHAAKRQFSSRQLSLRRVTANPSEAPVLNGTISPDGKYLAFSDKTGFYLRLIDTGETHPVSLPTGFKPEPASWFPDGAHLLATWVPGPKESPGIWEISTLGGEPRKIADSGANPSVSPDGKLIAYTTNSSAGLEMWVMQADGQTPHKIAGDFETEFGAATWSPDARNVAYVKFKYHPGSMGADAQIEVASAQGGNSHVILPNPSLGPALSWTRDGRLIYSVQERPPSQGDFNLWSARINDRTGQLESAPERLTSDAGGIRRISLSSDGKRLAFLRETLQRDVYITDLSENGTKLSPPRLLTLDERQDFPYDWTADGKAVLFTSDRDGAYHIFRQNIDQATAELVIGGNEDLGSARLSPDRQWIIYLQLSTRGYVQLPSRADQFISTKLMRVPVSGGPPQLILQAPGIHNQQCARSSNLCLFAEFLPDGVKMFSFDPMNGATREIALPRISGEERFPYNWSLSPDGKMLARALKLGAERDPSVRFFSLEKGTEQIITLPAWAGVTSIDWATDGKSLWAGAYTNTNKWALLKVELNGRVREMLQDDKQVIGWAIPSPDGKHLAIWKGSGSANVWMLEGF
jgi:Tol biopolymer transport system component/DNA-binding winged helix-turn-helix (wHTH) protein